jgi:hypothetical protein
LQVWTSGGFLLNIITYNMNPLSLRGVFARLWFERSSSPVMVLALLAGWFVCRSAFPSIARGQFRATWHQIRDLRAAEKAFVCRGLLLLDFVLVSLMTSAILKSGSNVNYLLDFLAIGCTLIGIMLVDYWRGTAGGRWAFSATISVLMLTVAIQSVRHFTEAKMAETLPSQEALVQRIAAASKPVASDDMALLMRAGKQVVFEPAIVNALAEAGAWDQTPLLQMIRSNGFAFMLTVDDNVGGGGVRTPAVDAAMREAYPRVEKVGASYFLHLPRD